MIATCRPHLEVVVLVELHSATSAQQSAFAYAMADRCWSRVVDLDDAHQMTLETNATEDEITEAAQRDVDDAAIAAGVRSWNGVCLINGAPSETMLQPV